MPALNKWPSKKFLKRLFKVFFYSFAFLFLLGIIGIIYYKQVTKITPPKVDDLSALDWQRDSIAHQFYKVKNNWLRKSNSGLWEMYIEGSPFERGAAAGKLTKELLYFQELAFVNKLKEMVPNEKYMKFLKYFIAWFNRNLDDHVPLEYQLEIYGESFFGPKEFLFIGKNYDRMLNYHAAHDMGHALANANMVGCTSFSVKDSASSNGKLLIGRNLDFNMGDAFAANKMVLFINPDSGYNHAFITWPGFLGVTSGMNQQGLTVTLNAAPSKMPFASKTPISILAREILQYAKNIREAIIIAQKRKTFVSELIMIGSANDHNTVIIEKSPSKMFVHKQESSVLTCTNHYQSPELQSENKDQYISTSTIYRKKRIDQLVNRSIPISPFSVALILRDYKGLNDTDIGLGNENAINQLAAHHGVIFMPEEKKMWVSANPYQMGIFVCYNLDSVFSKAGNLSSINKEIYDSISSIEEDYFIYSKKYLDWVEFKLQSSFLKYIIHKKLSYYLFAEGEIQYFLWLNRKYYLGYSLVAEYFVLQKNYSKGAEMFEKALEKNIPLMSERIKLEKRLEWVKKKIN